MAAYTAGLGRGRERRRKEILDLLELTQRGNIYRQPRGGRAFVQQGTWKDQLEDPFKTPKEKMQIRAQREANARAQRMGESIPFPDAEQQFIPAPTEQEKRWEHEEQVAQRNRQWRLQDQAAASARSAKEQADADTLSIFKTNFTSLKKEFDAIGAGGVEWADPARRKKYYEIKRGLAAGERDQEGDRQFYPLEYYQTAIEKMTGFLETHDPSHIKRQSPLDALSGSLVTFDEGTGQFREPRAGDRPSHTFINGQLRAIPKTAEQESAAKAQAEAARQREKLNSLAMAIMKEEDPVTEDKKFPDYDDALSEAKRRLGIHDERYEEGLYDSGRPHHPNPIRTGQDSPANDDELIDTVVDVPDDPGLPSEMPAGDGSIRLETLEDLENPTAQRGSNDPNWEQHFPMDEERHQREQVIQQPDETKGIPFNDLDAISKVPFGKQFTLENGQPQVKLYGSDYVDAGRLERHGIGRMIQGKGRRYMKSKYGVLPFIQNEQDFVGYGLTRGDYFIGKDKKVHQYNG
jgi:hypothetical protein